MLTRRFVLGAGTAAVATFSLPRMAVARVSTGRRFVFIIQRGAADGLSIVGPTGDPLQASVRGEFDQDLRSGVKLGSFFTLHPALVETAHMYGAKEALFVHAVASPYRDRSHFDGQNVLETGGSAAYQLSDGWFNCLLGLLPSEEFEGARPFRHPAHGCARHQPGLLIRSVEACGTQLRPASARLCHVRR